MGGLTEIPGAWISPRGYGPGHRFDRQIKQSRIEANIHLSITGIQSSLLVFPLNFLIVQLFRLSRPRQTADGAQLEDGRQSDISEKWTPAASGADVRSDDGFHDVLSTSGETPEHVRFLSVQSIGDEAHLGSEDVKLNLDFSDDNFNRGRRRDSFYSVDAASDTDAAAAAASDTDTAAAAAAVDRTTPIADRKKQARYMIRNWNINAGQTSRQFDRRRYQQCFLLLANCMAEMSLVECRSLIQLLKNTTPNTPLLQHLTNLAVPGGGQLQWYADERGADGRGPDGRGSSGRRANLTDGGKMDADNSCADKKGVNEEDADDRGGRSSCGRGANLTDGGKSGTVDKAADENDLNEKSAAEMAERERETPASDIQTTVVKIKRDKLGKEFQADEKIKSKTQTQRPIDADETADYRTQTTAFDNLPPAVVTKNNEMTGRETSDSHKATDDHGVERAYEYTSSKLPEKSSVHIEMGDNPSEDFSNDYNKWESALDIGDPDLTYEIAYNIGIIVHKPERISPIVDENLSSTINSLSTADNHEKTEDRKQSNEERKRRRKASGYLPWWCIYVAWFLVLVISLGSAFFTILYGLSYGRARSINWLIAMVESTLASIFVIQPLKVVLLSLLISAIWRRFQNQFLVDFEDIRNIEGEKLIFYYFYRN